MSWGALANVVVVVPPDWVSPVKKSLEILDNVENIHVVGGGSSRQDSAARGVNFLAQISQHSWVMIHDAARPAVTLDLIEKIWAAAQKFDKQELGGVIPAIPVSETVKQFSRVGDYLQVEKTLARESLVLVQTPQLLRRTILERAYREVGETGAVDDSSLVEKLGFQVILVDGERYNIKVTFKEDMENVSHWLRQRHPPV